MASRAAKIKAHDPRMGSFESPDMGLLTHKFGMGVTLNKIFFKNGNSEILGGKNTRVF